MGRNNRGPVPLWQFALYIAVLGIISMLLAPLTTLWWIIAVLGVLAPVVLAVIQSRDYQERSAKEAPEAPRVADTSQVDSDGPVECPALDGGALDTGTAAGGLAVAALASSLSEREREVLAQLAAGKTNAEVARALFISVGTVKSHSANIYRKLDARNRTEAVARARELGLLQERQPGKENEILPSSE